MTTTLDAAPGTPPLPAAARSGLRARWSRIVRPPRVAGLDLARALAVVGMIAAHVGGAPQLVLGDPGTWAGVVHGRSSLLFALVAGVSIALLARGVRTAPVDEVRRVRLTLVGRGAVVLLLGVILELVGSPVAIILGFYGVVFLLVAPVVGWSTRRLLVVVGLIVAITVPLVALAKTTGIAGGSAAQLVLTGMYPLPVWLALALTGIVVGRGDLRSVRRAVALVGVGVVLCTSGYGGAALLAPRAADDPGVSGPDGSGSSYVEIPGEDVDLGGYRCVRIDPDALTCWRDDDAAASGSAGSASASSHSATAAPGPDAATPSGQDASGDASFGWEGSPGWWRPPFVFDGVTSTVVVTALVSMEPHSGGLGEVVGSGGFVLAVLGLCLLLGRPRVLRLLLVPVAALGSMPLTVYSLHIVSFLVPRLVEPASATTWLWQVGALTLLATVWALTLGRGPLERLTAWVAARYAVRTGPAPRRRGRVRTQRRGLPTP